MSAADRITPIDVRPDEGFAAELAASTITVQCCRTWEVTPLMPWGRCKRCGTKPEVKQ